MRCIGKAIDTGRQQAGQYAGPEPVAGFAALVVRPKMTCAIFPSGEGSTKSLPGLAVKSLASANCRACAGSPSLISAHVALVAKVIGMAEAAGAVSNGDCMSVSRKQER